MRQNSYWHFHYFPLTSLVADGGLLYFNCNIKIKHLDSALYKALFYYTSG